MNKCGDEFLITLVLTNMQKNVLNSFSLKTLGLPNKSNY